MSDEVCVVGAGPAGIVTGKVFLEDGFDVTIYEKFDELGGTWSSRRRYVDLHAQADAGLLEFSDLPNDEPFPSAESVQAYLREYADRFDVRERISFETEVVDVTERPDGWTVATRDVTDGQSAGDRVEHRFDYVVVCSGLHHHPRVPDVPGRDEYEGTVLHSSEVDSREPFEDRRVATVGFGKSALDMSVEAARVADSSTLVFRRANWMIPKRLLGGTVPYRYLLFSRLGGSLLPRYHNDDCVGLLDRLPAPLKGLCWRAITKDLVFSAGLHRADDVLVPDADLPEDSIRVGVYPDDFPRFVREDRIDPVKDEIAGMDADGLRLESGERVDADVVVFATGFRKEFPFLASDLDFDLETDDGRFRAYRSIVPPETDRLGFVGLRQTFTNFFSMEVSAHWLASYFRAELDPMPSRAEMQAAIDRRLEWQASTLPRSRGFAFGPYGVHTVDELLRDMGIPTRQSPNLLAEYLTPPKPRDYADLTERRERASAPSEPSSTLPVPRVLRGRLGR